MTESDDAWPDAAGDHTTHGMMAWVLRPAQRRLIPVLGPTWLLLLLQRCSWLLIPGSWIPGGAARSRSYDFTPNPAPSPAPSLLRCAPHACLGSAALRCASYDAVVGHGHDPKSSSATTVWHANTSAHKFSNQSQSHHHKIKPCILLLPS